MTRPHSSSSFLTGDDRKTSAVKPKAKLRSGHDPERSKRAQQWLAENMAALDAYNDYVAERGLPLAKYRLF